MLKQKIKKMLTGEIHKQKSKIKKQLGSLIRHMVFVYKIKNKKYPFYVDDIKNLKDDNNQFLNPFYDIYSDEIELIMLEIFVDDLKENIDNYVKENKKYPLLEDLNLDIRNTFESLFLDSQGFKLIITDYIVSEIKRAPKANKIRSLFKEAFLNNEKLFMKFIFINLDKEKKFKEFDKLGKEIKEIIQDVENKALMYMEGGLHADKSVNVSDKYKTFVRTIFPLYYNIGVTTKKLSKKEMEEYIKKMNKK